MQVRAEQEQYKWTEYPPRSRASMVPDMHRAKKKQECMTKNTMNARRPCIRAVRHRPVARRSSRAPWRRALEHAGEALASAWLHPSPRSGRWSPAAAQTDLGEDQSRVDGHRGPCLQAPQLAAEGCMVTRVRVGVQARSLVASGLTRPSKYAPNFFFNLRVFIKE